MTLAVTREIPAERRDLAIQSLATLIASYLPGKPLVVRVERRKRKRTNLQNAALWGCAYKALHEQSGNDPEDLHTYFCGEFWGWADVDVMGQRRRKPWRSTTKDEHGEHDVIPTVLMAEFYDFIQRRAAEVGYDVPDPDPNWWATETAA